MVVVSCTCSGKTADRRKNWRVRFRNVNYSAFNGYHATISDYSGLVCQLCERVWRTKAAYVRFISDELRSL